MKGNIILTLSPLFPSVVYKIHMTDGTMVQIANPTDYPDPAYIDYCEEPFANAYIYVPSDYVGTGTGYVPGQTWHF